MLAMQWGVSLDALRAFLRRRPDLTQLGTVYGPLRLYDHAAAAIIREAYVASRQHRTQPAGAA